MRALGLLATALVACNQTGTAPLGEPLDQVAGFAGVPTMQPGADCLSCHRAGGAASDRIWTVAGTVFPSPEACPPDGGAAGPSAPGCSTGIQGVQVLLVDDGGQELTLTTNSAGNFYTDQPIGPLTSIMIQNKTHRMEMNLTSVGGGAAIGAGALINGGSNAGVSCNICHTAANAPPTQGNDGAPGSLFIQGN